MKTKIVIIGLVLFIFVNQAIASNPYGKLYSYEVYYNGNILQGTEVAKPILKIGEPFEIKVNMTVYQEYKVSGALYEIGTGNFEVIEGPSKMNKYSGKILMANESHIFKWIVKPTEGWAGGTLPINFRYSLLEKGNPEPVLNSGFTVAYPYISTEYYEGNVPSPATSPSEALPSSNSTSSESIPAFTLLTALFALTLASFRR